MLRNSVDQLSIEDSLSHAFFLKNGTRKAKKKQKIDNRNPLDIDF